MLVRAVAGQDAAHPVAGVRDGVRSLSWLSEHPLVLRVPPPETAAIASDADAVVAGVVELRVQDGVVLPHDESPDSSLMGGAGWAPAGAGRERAEIVGAREAPEGGGTPPEQAVPCAASARAQQAARSPPRGNAPRTAV